jgi:hypothetical protein
VLGQGGGYHLIYVIRTKTQCAQSVGHPYFLHQFDNRTG